ncbi:MAG: S-layer homology domain-containing protein [Clostridiales Family XIII bacterium]|nr:S-layer homology domain-containing protein [Clostridiales Family XIII bacterium]
MKKTTFRRNLALLIALVFLMTTAVPSAFAAISKITFGAPVPSFVDKQTNNIGLKPLHLDVEVPQGTTTTQAIDLSITGSAVSKFFLTKDPKDLNPKEPKRSVVLDVPTKSSLTWRAETVYLGIVSGSALKANEQITINARDGNVKDSQIFSKLITVATGGSSSGGTGSGGGVTPPKKPDATTKPADKPKPGTGTSGGASAFHDIKPSDWFYADVEFVVKNGLFNGVSATSFAPNTPMSRGMIVTALGRLNGVDTKSYAAGSFKDVAAGQYYTAYVEWAKANGIVNGVGENSFAPDRDVSRQDFAVILVRYAEFVKKPIHSTRQPITFGDQSQIAGYAKNAIRTLYAGGIINGMDNNAFAPAKSATRAEVAAMLHRFAEAIK